MAEFKIGDTVRLISGGPTMTVNKVNDNDISCQWFNEKKELTGATFQNNVLVHYKGSRGVRIHRF